MSKQPMPFDGPHRAILMRRDGTTLDTAQAGEAGPSVFVTHRIIKRRPVTRSYASALAPELIKACKKAYLAVLHYKFCSADPRTCPTCMRFMDEAHDELDKVLTELGA